jgi:hypothetical protein
MTVYPEAERDALGEKEAGFTNTLRTCSLH